MKKLLSVIYLVLIALLLSNCSVKNPKIVVKKVYIPCEELNVTSLEYNNDTNYTISLDYEVFEVDLNASN